MSAKKPLRICCKETPAILNIPDGEVIGSVHDIYSDGTPMGDKTFTVYQRTCAGCGELYETEQKTHAEIANGKLCKKCKTKERKGKRYNKKQLNELAKQIKTLKIPRGYNELVLRISLPDYKVISYKVGNT